MSGDFCYTEQVSESTTAPWDSGKEEKEKRTTQLGTLKRRKRLADSPGPDRLLVHRGTVTTFCCLAGSGHYVHSTQHSGHCILA
jgi:hypothetical protein